jgi:hypothetical protein
VQFLAEHLKQEGLRGVEKKVVAGKHPQRKGASSLVAPGFKVAARHFAILQTAKG